MNYVLLKIKKEYLRMVVESIFEGMDCIDPEEVKPYSPRSSIEKGQWFYIDSVKQKDYFDDILIADDTVEYPLLDRQKLSDCKFILDYHDECLCVQNITSYKVMKKRMLSSNGFVEQGFKLIINDEPDFIYDENTDRLYFKSLTAVSHLLPGIIMEYREATEEEVRTFVDLMDIDLVDGYTQQDIKTRNRKLIALVSSKVTALSDSKRQKLFDYVEEYCPQFVIDSKMTVRSEKELHELLLALDERFYTTPVTGVRRKALTVDGDVEST